MGERIQTPSGTAPARRMSPERDKQSRITLRDVAERAGVHPGTASRALMPATRELVNAKTAERVMEAAAALGYRPNPIARGLKTNRSHAIGVVIPDLTNPLFPPMVRGIQDRLERDAYTPLIANTDNDPDREIADFEAMRDRQVDGFISATARSAQGMLASLESLDRPVVLVNRRLEGSGLRTVAVNDYLGARLAVNHLIGLGHSRIAHLGGPQDLSTGHERRRGFVDAMRAAGIEPDPSLMPAGSAFIESEGARLCAQVLDLASPPTAVVAGNDLMALGCYELFADRGVRCPERISVVGFNDMPFAEWFNPPMTTIRIPHYAVGSRAAELVLALLRGGFSAGAGEAQILLEPELIVRGSTSGPDPSS